MNKIARFIFFDILKNKIIIFYTILLFILSWSVLGLESNYTKATLSLLNVVLLVVPLVSIIFSTIYAVSYTHLDVYKRQFLSRGKKSVGNALI